MATSEENDEIDQSDDRDEVDESQSGPSRRDDAPEGVRNLAVPIGLLIVSILFGVGAWILVVFGAWPAVVLVLLSAVTSAIAVRWIKRAKPASMP